jgi:non-specific serine/threonine protein kinase
MAVLVADFATARLRAEEGLALHRTLGDASGIARSHFELGFAAVEEGDFKGAQPFLEESVRLFRELGDEHNTGIATLNLAWVYDELGDRKRARALTEDELHRARALGDERSEAFALDWLEGYARTEGRIREALSITKESLRIRRDLADPAHLADNLSRFAALLAVHGQTATAARLLSRSELAYEEISVSVPRYVAERNEETLATIRAQLNEADFAESWEQGQKLTVDEAVAFALDFEMD